MAHRRGFRGRGISDSQRRKKTWVSVKLLIGGGEARVPGFSTGINLSVTPGTLSGEASRDGFILSSGDGTGNDPLVSTLPEESTILRIRGSLDFPTSDGAPAILATDINTSFGFGVTGLTDNNATSYPGPISDADWDGWMFLRQSHLKPVSSDGTVVDVKSMRKLKSGDAFFIMAEGVPLSNMGNVLQEWHFDLRLLLLLP